MTNNTVAFIGCGSMGRGMVQNLIKGGFRVQAFDLNSTALAEVSRIGAIPTSAAREAAIGANYAVTMLPESSHIEAAVFGKDGLAETLAKGTLLIQTSSIDASSMIRFANSLSDRGIRSVDSPVLKDAAAAASGTLAILSAGNPMDTKDALPIQKAIGESVNYVGSIGQASILKALNNSLNFTIRAATIEALVTGAKSGLAVHTMVDAFRKTGAKNLYLDNIANAEDLHSGLAPKMRAGLVLKDLKLGVTQASSVGVPNPIIAAAANEVAMGEALVDYHNSIDPVLALLERIADPEWQYSEL